MKSILLLGSILGGIATPHIALAQTSGAGPTQSSANSANIETIIVTAQRRAENLQDAAIPIVAATGAQLAQAGVSDVTGLNKVAPSLNIVNQAGSATSFFIRGVGNFNNNNLSDPAVAFNFDGVYVGRPSSTAAFLDVERVEVLKGPQGTLYGRNATGGAINVIPVRPKLGQFGGFVEGNIGNYDSYDLSGAVNAPLGDNAALRVSGVLNGHDGYFSDGTGGVKNRAIRGQIYTELSPSLNVRVLGEYSTRKGSGPGTNLLGAYVLTPNIFQPGVPTTIPNYTFVPAPSNVSEPFTGLYAPQSIAYFTQFPSAPLFSRTVAPTYPSVDDEIWGVNAEINLDLGGATVTVVPAYRNSKLHNIYSVGVFKAARQDETAKQVSLEGRIAGTAGPVDYIAGLFYFDEDTTFKGAFNQYSLVNFPNSEAGTTSWATFSRLVFNVSDNFRVVGGIRYTEDKKRIDVSQFGLTAICVTTPLPNCSSLPTMPVSSSIEEAVSLIDPSFFVSGLTPLDVPVGVPVPYVSPIGQAAIMIRSRTVVQDSSNFNRVTWRGALEYDLTPDNLLYASYESGYRSGGFNTTFGRETYTPEYIDAFTLGSKNEFFGGRLRLNIEGFIWKYRDQQFSHLGLDLAGASSFFTENIGRSTLQGVDVDFRVAPTRKTIITGAVQYLDAKNTRFVYQVPNQSPIVTPVTSCPVSTSTINTASRPIAAYAINCAGTRPLNAPKWTVNLGIEQTISLGRLDLVANGDGQYRSTRELDFAYLPTSRSGEDLTLAASLTLRPEDRKWFVSAFVRNLTNNDVLTSHQFGTSNVTSVSYEPPRTYGVRAGIDF